MPTRSNFGLSIAILVVMFSTASSQDYSYNELAGAVMETGHTISLTKAPAKARAPVPIKAQSLADHKEIPKHGVVKYDIYRDRTPYPIDPRKPCHICTQRKSNSKFAALHSRIYGFQGRPYQEKEPGGCLCGKKKQKFKRSNLNVYWPTFAAGVPEEYFPVRSAAKASNYDRFRLVDIFDHLGGWELSPYERRDNGYCGPGRDPYGCLGESRHFQSQVRGVGFRVPGQPVERGGIVYP